MSSSKVNTTPLPIKSATPEGSEDKPSNSGRKIRVLVIDDSRTVRIAATRIFGKGFDVLIAVDGRDGLRAIESDPSIQVVFTDLVMPEMDGFELLEALRAHKSEYISNLPIIVMTGAENPEVAKQKAIALGATDFITKPFQATDICARARSYAKLNLTTKILKEQTTFDELTGVMNLRGLQYQLEKEIAFVSRHQHPLSVITVEIDNYKGLFITMGRASAETVIRRLGQTMVNSFRKEDSIARSGLGRFFVSMPLVEKENAMEIANKVCQTVESFKAKLNGKRLPLTVSTGIASFKPAVDTTPDAAIEMAEQALSKAKELGVSQLYCLTPEDYTKLREQELSIDTLLEQLHEGNELAVAKQLNSAVEKLSPLISLLSNEQKQRLLNSKL